MYTEAKLIAEYYNNPIYEYKVYQNRIVYSNKLLCDTIVPFYHKYLKTT
jgi:galactose-1-phosphate uridylyltransferase